MSSRGRRLLARSCPKPHAGRRWGVPAPRPGGVGWGKGFFADRENKRMPREGGAAQKDRGDAIPGDVTHVSEVLPNQLTPPEHPPTCQQAGALHQQLEGKLVRKRVAGPSPKDVNTLHGRRRGWLAPGTRPPETAGGAARGEVAMAPTPSPLAQHRHPPPRTAETEEAMKITIGPTCRHTSLPARSRGRWGRGA